MIRTSLTLALHAIAQLAGVLLAALYPDTTMHMVLNHGRVAGEMQVVATGDSVVVRYQYQDRQRGPRILTRYRFGGDTLVLGTEASGLSAAGMAQPVRERFEVSGGWALLARLLPRRPRYTARLLPVGSARLEIAAETLAVVNGTRERLRLAVIEGAALTPVAVWLDGRDALVASEVANREFITVRRGSETVLPALRPIEKAYQAQGWLCSTLSKGHSVPRERCLTKALTAPAVAPRL